MKHDKDDIIVRPATAEDVDAFRAMYATERQYSGSLPYTIRAWVVVRNGELACIAGVVFGKGYTEAFSDMAPGLKASPRIILHYAKILADKIKSLKITAIALVKEESDTSKFLEKVGLTYVKTHFNRKVFRT